MTATTDILATLHNAVAEDLLGKVLGGEATAQELNAAIKFLKDNGIEALPVENSPLADLASSLPSFTDEDSDPLH
tara:strand:- start:2141 stop:2365 length:225 start_codon:yes stop_codon:yes gene_type:complete